MRTNNLGGIGRDTSCRVGRLQADDGRNRGRGRQCRGVSRAGEQNHWIVGRGRRSRIVEFGRSRRLGCGKRHAQPQRSCSNDTNARHNTWRNTGHNVHVLADYRDDGSSARAAFARVAQRTGLGLAKFWLDDDVADITIHSDTADDEPELHGLERSVPAARACIDESAERNSTEFNHGASNETRQHIDHSSPPE
jgi:hypothetical protein